MPAFSLPYSPPVLTNRLLPVQNAPLPRTDLNPYIRSFGGVLSPPHFRRDNTRPVSYYALFQGWLLLSQPPGCLGVTTSLSHLARSSGP